MRLNYSILAFSLVLTLVFISGCASEPTAADIAFAQVAQKDHPAVTPQIQDAGWAKDWWMPRHDKNNERFAQGDVDLLMIGDSITHHWDEEVWNEYYAPRNAVDMGFGGDKTEHVLWRLENSNFDKINPELAVIMIGTNNVQRDTPRQIADGIIAVCAKVRSKLPKTKILLLAIFPRGAKADNPLRVKNAKASLIASKIADDKMIDYMNINDKFLAPDGTLSKKIMPDLLHPSKTGYEIWAKAIEPKVAELMGE